ncbi:hypothetical protein AB434_3825 [Heyndrickxia coagulans]|nr:hypothetical protein AB434_0156 [Heyndrickxia coagulans]AKN52649.1 hypothetical protein AB434_0244 [Heyndrickxia coagulans]AKN52669.1 hypothetical protein AB434_0264 [Heyndrickxia coagulans]AKN53083.1 hypothetical protein AB434_0678 [Heyndrickxia coagulans]AKN53088.1 hypothetical protein AB434_0683 [Heyndrickxia coagulans]
MKLSTILKKKFANSALFDFESRKNRWKNFLNVDKSFYHKTSKN